jgi:hypothetical protein
MTDAFGYHQFHVILASQGTGKTTLARELTRAWLPSRLYVHDPYRDPIWEPCHWCDENNPPALHDVCVVLDECHRLIRPGGDFASPWVEELVWGGRRQRVARVFISIRPQWLSTSITSQARDVWLGRMMGARDVDYCVRYWGEQCEQLRSIPRGQFLHIEI